MVKTRSHVGIRPGGSDRGQPWPCDGQAGQAGCQPGDQGRGRVGMPLGL